MTTDAPTRLLSDLPTPAFVVNRHAFRRNCERVRSSAFANGIHRLRPHIKTHKTWEGTLIQVGVDSNGKGQAREDGAADVVGLVVSTLPELSMVVDMACKYKFRSFVDVLYGIPICISKLPAILELKRKLKLGTNGDGNIHLLVDHPDQVDFLERFARDHSEECERWSVFLKVDTGYHRAGTTCDGVGVALAAKIIESAHLILTGLYSHCGHAYNTDDNEERGKIVHDDHSKILELLNLLESSLESKAIAFDISSLDISVGSTPSMLSHKPLDIPNNVEVHAGNYVFYDRQQIYTGACANESSIGGFVLTRVIGHYKDPERNAIMVDAGATALTKDAAPQGDVCAVSGRPDLECYRMSQEVTMIRCRDGSMFPFEDFPFGSTMLLIPNHSCLAAACFDLYHIVDEKGSPFGADAAIVDTWKPVKGWA